MNNNFAVFFAYLIALSPAIYFIISGVISRNNLNRRDNLMQTSKGLSKRKTSLLS
jgi:hypothetical protein